MKKIYLLIFFTCLLLATSIPIIGLASECSGQTGIVRCGQDTSCPCEICDFFAMLVRIYDFIVKMIATPLAVIAIIIGAILMMISAGNPNLMSTGKKVLYSAIIGLVLVFCSYLIIDFILHALGYTGSWTSLSMGC